MTTEHSVIRNREERAGLIRVVAAHADDPKVRAARTTVLRHLERHITDAEPGEIIATVTFEDGNFVDWTSTYDPPSVDIPGFTTAEHIDRTDTTTDD